MIGRMKFYDEGKGFGFVTSKNGIDAFVHHSEIKWGQTLLDGEVVSYATRDTPKGKKAIGVDTITLPKCKECGDINNFDYDTEELQCWNNYSSDSPEGCKSSEHHKRKVRLNAELEEKKAAALENLPKLYDEIDEELDGVEIPTTVGAAEIIIARMNQIVRDIEAVGGNNSYYGESEHERWFGEKYSDNPTYQRVEKLRENSIDRKSHLTKVEVDNVCKELTDILDSYTVPTEEEAELPTLKADKDLLKGKMSWIMSKLGYSNAMTTKAYSRANEIVVHLATLEETILGKFRPRLPSRREVEGKRYEYGMIQAIATRYYRDNEEKCKPEYGRMISFRALFRSERYTWGYQEIPGDLEAIIELWEEIEATYIEEITLAMKLLKYEGEDKLSLAWIVEALQLGLLTPFLKFDVETTMEKVREGDRIVKEWTKSNTKYLIDLGVSGKTIAVLVKTGLLGRVDLREINYNADKLLIDKIYSKIAKDEDSSTEARMKADSISSKGKSFISLGKIVNKAKGTREEITSLIKKHYANIGDFDIRDRAHPTDPDERVNFLLLWDEKGERIYHSTGRR